MKKPVINLTKECIEIKGINISLWSRCKLLIFFWLSPRIRISYRSIELNGKELTQEDTIRLLLINKMVARK